jgi:hypothetical protein
VNRVITRFEPGQVLCFRFNNRKNQFLSRDTLTKLILSPNLEYKDLTAKAQDAA